RHTRMILCVSAPRRLPSRPRFPYTTLFRSNLVRAEFGEDAEFGAAIAETTEWLEGFHHDSVVELDYGGLAARMDYEELRREDSVDRKSTRLNSSHVKISYAVFCLKKKNKAS